MIGPVKEYDVVMLKNKRMVIAMYTFECIGKKDRYHSMVDYYNRTVVTPVTDIEIDKVLTKEEYPEYYL